MPMPMPQANSAPPSMGQPPVGSSPATAPMPNKGLEAAGMAQLGLVVRQLEKIVPLLGAGTEAGKDVLKALTSLSKHIPPGAVAPGAEQTALQGLLMKMKQQAPQLAAMRQAMAQKQPAPAAEPPEAPEKEAA